MLIEFASASQALLNKNFKNMNEKFLVGKHI
jgi:hypothetical protein